MEKCFIVQAKDLEHALDKAAIILHWPRERIAYELLQEPEQGKYGRPGIPCKLRVIPVAPTAEELTTGSVADQEDAGLDQGLPPISAAILNLRSSTFLQALDAGAAIARGLPAPEYFQWSIAPQANSDQGFHIREIFGDYHASAGFLRHEGDLVVRGSILKGAMIAASGSIRVGGEVETAFLDAGHDIEITGGMLGTARTVHGKISCRFAQGAQLKSLYGDVSIIESAMHSQIHAGRGATIGGILLGGVCYGEQWVEVGTAGSPTGVPTIVMSGHNRAIHDQIEHLRRRAVRHVERLRQYEALKLDISVEQGGHRLEADERARLWRSVMRRARIQQDLIRLTKQKSRLLGMINSDHGSRISVIGVAHPKCKISVDDITIDLQVETQYATFSKDYDTGVLRMTPFS